jgi:tetratricopeptide (TPR) repeat protein
MGGYHREATGASLDAQKFFDQGLTFGFAFNHDEAIRSFTEAARLSPDCPMAWFGIAFYNGPHINNPAMDDAHSKAAWDALQKAKSVAAKGTSVEQALIGALEARYADPAKGKLPSAPPERAPLDRAFADAMARVHAAHPKDADVATWYAESMMDLRPWDLYDHGGTPRPETPQVIAALESAMQNSPNHPGANHLYIHATEASLNPERAVPAAEKLGRLAPGAGHLVHMPAHTFARVGRWEDAAESNRKAIAADAAYRKLVPTQGFYHIYMLHNRGFLAFACTMEGRSAEAIKAAHEMIESVPPPFLTDMAPVIDGYLAIELEVLMRFGKWEEILAYPKPAANLPILTAMWHFSRGVAFANTSRLAEAGTERAEFQKAAVAVPPDRKAGNSPAPTVMKIAGKVLDAEIAFKSGRNQEAIDALKVAIAAEDTLQYDEPPDWLQPVRHTLGAVYLAANMPMEAEEVYREDLKRWPENGWALYGLSESLKKQNSPEAPAVAARFAKTWAKADIKIGASCLCVQGQASQ